MRHDDYVAGAVVQDCEALDRVAACCDANWMIEITGHDVGTAAQKRAHGLRASSEVFFGQLDSILCIES